MATSAVPGSKSAIFDISIGQSYSIFSPCGLNSNREIILQVTYLLRASL